MKKLLSLLLAVLMTVAVIPQPVWAVNEVPVNSGDTETPVIRDTTPRLTEAGYPIGDVNGDGEVDKKDLTILGRYLSKWGGIELADTEAADIDGENGITAKDRMILARYLVKWDGYEKYFFVIGPDDNEGPLNPEF